MPIHKKIIKKVKKKIKELNERANREAAAKREKIDVANPFGRIRRLDPEPTRHAQEKRRVGR